MRHFDVDFQDKNGERYQFSKRTVERMDALLTDYYIHDSETLEPRDRLHAAVGAAAQCDLMEENGIPLQADGDALRLHFRPFEIKALKARLSRG